MMMSSGTEGPWARSIDSGGIGHGTMDWVLEFDWVEIKVHGPGTGFGTRSETGMGQRQVNAAPN